MKDQKTSKYCVILRENHEVSLVVAVCDFTLKIFHFNAKIRVRLWSLFKKNVKFLYVFKIKVQPFIEKNIRIKFNKVARTRFFKFYKRLTDIYDCQNSENIKINFLRFSTFISLKA